MAPTLVLVGALVAWSLRPQGAPSRSARPVAGSRTGAVGRFVVRAVLIGATIAALVTAPVVGAMVAVAIVVRRVGRAARVDRARTRAIERTLPDAIDLLSLVVSAGVSPRQALAAVAPRCPEPHRTPWSDVVARIEAGQDYPTAVGRLTIALGPPLQPLVSALVVAERDGVALVPALDRCAAEAHRRRRVRAEEAARRVPVLMLFPLVCCVLPAFGLLTIVPLLAGSVSDLRLPA
jgi:tight adherence protein C